MSQSSVTPGGRREGDPRLGGASPVQGRRLRVGVVGARTVAQGLGPYVARAFSTAGCEVVALVGTRPETVAQAQDDLARRYGLRCAGYLDVDAMLAEQSLDVAAICSPPEHHQAALSAACRAHVHVLCEKPLWWHEQAARAPAGALMAEVTAMATLFRARGRLLQLNAQWPTTLPAYRRLHPDAEQGGIRRFAMRLSPRGKSPGGDSARTRRERLVTDAAPHTISLLQALLGRGAVEDAHACEPTGAGAAGRAALDLRFTWAHAAGRTAVELELRQCPEPPRPAGYAINGRWADREVALPSYAMSLVSREQPARSEPLDDPLDAHVADFVAGIHAGRQTDVEALAEGLGALGELVGAAHGAEAAA